MVAAQWGETRDADARTGGGVSGRFRLLGGSGGAPDTTPPPFGTAPWGYRRSEVDAWASWVAGLVAHGRNETIRADSAEATLKATLKRLEQLERPGAPAQPPSDPGTVRPQPTRQLHDDGNGSEPEGEPGEPRPQDTTSSADESTVDGERAPDGPGTPVDLPRRTGRTATSAPHAGTAREAPAPEGGPDGAAPGDLGAGEIGAPAPGTPAGRAEATRTDPAPADGGERAATAPSAAADAPSGDHDLARLQVVETTLHEILELLHHLTDREHRPAGF